MDTSEAIPLEPSPAGSSGPDGPSVPVETDGPPPAPGPRRRRWTDWLSVAESVIALSLVLLLLTPLVLLLPQVESVRLVARPLTGAAADAADAGGEPAAVEDVRQAVADLGVAGSVDARERGGDLRLTLHRLDTPNYTPFAVDDVLRDRGWSVEDRTSFLEPDLNGLMRNERLVMAMLLVQGLALILIGGGLSIFRLGPPPLRRGGALRSTAIGAGLGFVALIGSMTIAQIQTLLGFQVQEQEAVVEMLRGIDLWKLVPFFVLLAPLSEEIFFRGYVLRYVARRLGPGLGYAVSAVLFAAIHLNPSGFLAYLTVGLVFAFAYRATGNLLAPIAAHMVYNGCAMAAALFLSRLQGL